MICPHCKTKGYLPHTVAQYHENYQPNGSSLVQTECCGKGIVVTSKMTYTVEKYTGKDKVDDWGREIKNGN